MTERLMLFSEGSENFTSPIVACDRMFTTGSLDFPKVTGKDRLAYIFSALELTWACFECCHHSQRFNKRERERGKTIVAKNFNKLQDLHYLLPITSRSAQTIKLNQNLLCTSYYT
jgi:hypothetical protein